MDIDFSPEDMAFQQEVRAWFKAHTPTELKRKTVTGEMLQKDDIVQWQRRLDHHLQSVLRRCVRRLDCVMTDRHRAAWPAEPLEGSFR